ncbi:hypothetical protein HMPREF9120_01704 [Neisseria sp. oral taxon 020 str. F0370]|nr:hypothetical protein HMPREF9120_01704 [Neisseria sp. oral taxon 020 str. F0370]
MGGLRVVFRLLRLCLGRRPSEKRFFVFSGCLFGIGGSLKGRFRSRRWW